MSKSKQVVLRVQSSEGTKRIDINLSDTISQLYEKVYEVFELNTMGFALFRQRNHKDELISTRNKTISGAGISHGDMLYIVAHNGSELWSLPSTSTAADNSYQDPGSMDTTGSTNRGKSVSNVAEDEVDEQLWKLDGKIQRKRDEKLCRHGANGCCVHCSPLEPFDEAYLKEQNIKHLSFHSYLTKLTAGVDRGKFIQLDDISCRIKTGCKDHPPWPRGICSKCQPNSITLNRQTYRHVDNVMFENASLVERFLNYWRNTGHQRIGFLYGRYEIHTDVPLGIRAVVAAIYEPPQENTKNSVKLLPDERKDVVDEMARLLNLKKVGWIFTDLIADDVKKGTVKHVRNIESHFLSAQECIMAGHFQNQYPNPCRVSPSNYFGSKFVTVCVTEKIAAYKNFQEVMGITNTIISEARSRLKCMLLERIGLKLLMSITEPYNGFLISQFYKEWLYMLNFSSSDDKNQVHMEGYQVSNQCMALVRDNCLVPTKDAPELGYVIESTDKQYVPDVFYKEKDTYGNEVPRLARPLPVEYLLVDVPVSTPLTPQFTFHVSQKILFLFPIENRLIEDQIQDLDTLSLYIVQFNQDEFLEAISDFHLLLFIATMDMLPMKEHMAPLLEAIRLKDKQKASEWERSEHWATVKQLMSVTTASYRQLSRTPFGSRRIAPSSVGSGTGVSADSANLAPDPSLWTCSYCTFLNAAHLTICDMCGLPRI